MDPRAIAALDELARRQEMAERLEKFLHLTPRQQQIARKYAEGRTMEQVAAAVFLAPDTVKYHLIHIYRKLGITAKPSTKCRDLAYLIGFVDGMGARRLRMVTHREEAA